MDDLVRVSITEAAYAIELLARKDNPTGNVGLALVSLESATARLRRFLTIANSQEDT